MYVFQLLYFLIAIDEFRVSVVLLRYNFLFMSNLCADRLESVSLPRRQTRLIWRRSQMHKDYLCIPIEDIAKALLCLSI